MQIHFHPPTLAVALQAPALYRFIRDCRPRGIYGQVFLAQWEKEHRLDLSFRPSQGPPVSISFEENLLWSASGEAELRSKVAELFGRSCAPTAAARPRRSGSI